MPSLTINAPSKDELPLSVTDEDNVWSAQVKKMVKYLLIINSVGYEGLTVDYTSP
jgi:hypothetical protein